MELVALVALPLLAGLVAFLLRPDPPRRVLLVAVAMVHAAFAVFLAWAFGTWHGPFIGLGGWLALDRPGLLVLISTDVVFSAAAWATLGYLRARATSPGHASEAIFTGSMLLFLATMSLMVISQNFGVMWVALEASTLASAPLIYFHRNARSLEATWKYLLVCSVGIALALLGNFFLAIANTHSGSDATTLTVSNLVARGPELAGPWLKAAFLFLVVGYGTKMGLVPMHTWLPDAHSEAPSVVSALLSGALLNCAFLGILRVVEVCHAAGLADFTSQVLRGFGILSMGIAAVFIYRQRDFKRMLAYSSVEHMGILALASGLGSLGLFAALWHALNHALTKTMLFLVSGDILEGYGTKKAADVQGLLRGRPLTGVLWLVGLFAITGMPPFPTFGSEMMVLRAALETAHPWIAAIFLVILGIVFVAMTATMLPMAHGESPVEGPRPVRGRLGPPLFLALTLIAMGLYLPPSFTTWLHEGARLLGGT